MAYAALLILMVHCLSARVALAKRASNVAVHFTEHDSFKSTALAPVESASDSCTALAISYLVMLPIPLPFANVPSAVGLLMCCPTWLYGKIKSKLHAGRDNLVAELNLTDAFAEQDMHAQNLDLYDNLVFKHQKAHKAFENEVKNKSLKGKKTPTASDYMSSMEDLISFQKQHPWLIYFQLAQAYSKEGLGDKELQEYFSAMALLKKEYDFLPVIEPSKSISDRVEVPQVLLAPERTEALPELSEVDAEAAKELEAGSDESSPADVELKRKSYLSRFGGKLKMGKEAMCSALSNKVNRFVNWVKSKKGSKTTPIQETHLQESVAGILSK